MLPKSPVSVMFSLKKLLISSVVVVVAVSLSLYLPTISEFVVTQVPVMWNSFRSWLTPPYLYFLINCIIITIAASSKFQKKNNEEVMIEPEPIAKVPISVVDLHQNFPVPPVYVDESVNLKHMAHMANAQSPEMETFADYNNEVVKFPVAIREEMEMMPVIEVAQVSVAAEVEENRSEEANLEEKDEFVISENSFEIQKPPVSGRFGYHRKIVRGSPEAGKAALRKVTKPKKQQTQDTLESTWKMITEGRSIPPARHLKKSDTWETTPHETPDQSDSPPMKKADTFNDHTDHHQSSSSSLTRSEALERIKKDPSLSQDDLNRKVEEFIKKFNEDMRLQRLASLQQYNDLMNSGNGGDQ